MSYLLFTAGAAGLTLTVAFILVDAPHLLVGAKASAMCRTLLRPCEVMGMNALLVFVCHGPAQNLVNAFYYAAPEPGNGIFDRQPAQGALLGGEGWVWEKALGAVFSDLKARQLVYVLFKLLGYILATWMCERRGYFWKI